jgi:hypothetical protein
MAGAGVFVDIACRLSAGETTERLGALLTF